jgi:18S rRNA (adenine1779-N6/adenine1780-N6)-dimethyltransferase
MFQSEFVNRILADPGEEGFSRLSMNSRLFVKAEKIMQVKGGSFVPAPQVESTVVRLLPRHEFLTGNNVDFLEWDALMRILFAKRREEGMEILLGDIAIYQLNLKYAILECPK